MFSRIFECDKPQVTFFKGPKKYFNNYCRSYKIISVTPKRIMETQNFEKKAVFPVKKIFWPILLVVQK